MNYKQYYMPVLTILAFLINLAIVYSIVKYLFFQYNQEVFTLHHPALVFVTCVLSIFSILPEWVVFDYYSDIRVLDRKIRVEQSKLRFIDLEKEVYLKQRELNKLRGVNKDESNVVNNRLKTNFNY